MGVNGDLKDVETGKRIASNGNVSVMLQSTSPGLPSATLHSVTRPLLLQDLQPTSYSSRTKWIPHPKSTSRGWHSYGEEKDYDSVNESPSDNKIEPYQGPNDDDNKIRKCNWNYIYSEVV